MGEPEPGFDDRVLLEAFPFVAVIEEGEITGRQSIRLLADEIAGLAGGR